MPAGVETGISRVFVEAFGEYLTAFSRDSSVLTAALAHMFVLDVFYVAVVDGEIAGIAACTDGTRPSVEPRASEIKKHLGWLRGTIAHRVFVREFQKAPLETGERMASVEFVATGTAFRRRGIAESLMTHILGLPQFDTFILEVADTNNAAVRLYEKVGFREFRRIQEHWTRARLSGITALVYMKYQRPS